MESLIVNCDVYASNIYMQPIFHQTHVNGKRKRKMGWVSTLIAFAQKLPINDTVDAFEGARFLICDLNLSASILCV